MKKNIIIIILIVIIIALLAIGALYLYSQNSIVDKTGMINNQVPNTDNKTTIFGGKTIEEWEKLVFDFYEKNLAYKPIELITTLDEYYRLDIKAYAYDTVPPDTKVLIDEFIIYEDTLIAEDTTGQRIDFIKGEYVEGAINNNVQFTDSICLAIGFIADGREQEFIDDYFFNEADYYQLKTLDIANSNKFVILPKYNTGTINVWSCKINDDYEVEKDELLLNDSNSNGIIVNTDEIEIMPSIAIQYIDDSGFECFIPLFFNGEDGKIVLTGNEADVTDISMY